MTSLLDLLKGELYDHSPFLIIFSCMYIGLAIIN